MDQAPDAVHQPQSVLRYSGTKEKEGAQQELVLSWRWMRTPFGGPLASCIGSQWKNAARLRVSVCVCVRVNACVCVRAFLTVCVYIGVCASECIRSNCCTKSDVLYISIVRMYI